MHLAGTITYNPCNGIDKLEDENPAPDDVPSISPRRLTKLQHGRAASANWTTPPRNSSPLHFPQSSPPAPQPIRPPSFVGPPQSSLPNTTNQAGLEDGTGRRYGHSGGVEHPVN